MDVRPSTRCGEAHSRLVLIGSGEQLSANACQNYWVLNYERYWAVYEGGPLYTKLTVTGKLAKA
jgi:hypothetical protein